MKLKHPHDEAIETGAMIRMIEPSGVLSFMGFGASRILRAGVDKQVAVPIGFVARRPAVDAVPIAATSDHVNVDDVSGKRAFPSAFPVWRGGAAGQNDKGGNGSKAHGLTLARPIGNGQ